MRAKAPRATVLLTVAATLGFGASAGADVEVVQVKTELKFLEVDRTDFMTFTGAIKARTPCRDDRTALLWYKPTEDAVPQKLASDRTNRKGRFEFELASAAQAGLYAATLKTIFEREDETKFVCKRVPAVFVSF
jgi:hypothetical protein